MEKGTERVQGIHDRPGREPRKRLLTVKEAAVYLARSEWAVRDLFYNGTLPVIRNENGRKIYFDIADLDQFIEGRKKIYK